ncbi:MAG: CopG family ribbon-helix-helix protein [Halanaerobiales bacterium]
MSCLGNVKKVMVSLPNKLLEEIDGYVKKGNGNRSEFIREAMRLYIREKRRQEMREQLRNGYVEMSDINLELAAEGLKYDAKIICYYEESLAECE